MSTINQETFAVLVKEYMPNMYRLACGILNNPADAEDAVGEAVLKAWENLGSLRRPESFKFWMMQITANESRKIYRKRRRTACVESVEEMVPAFFDDHHELWDAVMKLELWYREVIILYFYEQLSVKEVGQVLHIAEGTVKSRLSRGKKILKGMLDN